MSGVGEHGPEWWDLPEGTRVYPGSDLGYRLRTGPATVARESIPARIAAAIFWSLIRAVPIVVHQIRRRKP